MPDTNLDVPMEYRAASPAELVKFAEEKRSEGNHLAYVNLLFGAIEKHVVENGVSVPSADRDFMHAHWSRIVYGIGETLEAPVADRLLEIAKDTIGRGSHGASTAAVKATAPTVATTVAVTTAATGISAAAAPTAGAALSLLGPVGVLAALGVVAGGAYAYMKARSAQAQPIEAQGVAIQLPIEPSPPIGATGTSHEPVEPSPQTASASSLRSVEGSYLDEAMNGYMKSQPASLELYKFLGRHLSAEQKREAVHWARRKQLTGTDEGVWCEWLLTTPPPELLKELFLPRDLHKLAEAEGYRGGGDPADYLTNRFGFHVPKDSVGLDEARRAIDKWISKARLESDKAALTAAAVESCKQLERILKDLIVFYGNIFRDPTGREVLLDDNERKGNITIGSQLNILLKLESQVRADPLGRKLKLLQIFKRKEIIGLETLQQLQSKVPSERAANAHYKAEYANLTVEVTRERVLELLQKIRGFLNELAQSETRIYPHVIVARTRVEDEYGRKHVEAVDEHGGHERIYTDRELQLGQRYFMYPITNPVRINPLLVAYEEAD